MFVRIITTSWNSVALILQSQLVLHTVSQFSPSVTSVHRCKVDSCLNSSQRYTFLHKSILKLFIQRKARQLDRGRTGKAASKLKVIIRIFPLYSAPATQELSETVVTDADSSVCDFEAEDYIFLV